MFEVSQQFMHPRKPYNDFSVASSQMRNTNQFDSFYITQKNYYGTTNLRNNQLITVQENSIPSSQNKLSRGSCS